MTAIPPRSLHLHEAVNGMAFESLRRRLDLTARGRGPLPIRECFNWPPADQRHRPRDQGHPSPLRCSPCAWVPFSASSRPGFGRIAVLSSTRRHVERRVAVEEAVGFEAEAGAGDRLDRPVCNPGAS